MKMSSKSKSFDDRSWESNLAAALSTSRRSAADKEMSKLGLHAYGMSWTFGIKPGEGVEFVKDKDFFLSIDEDRPEYESVVRGLCSDEWDIAFWKAAMARSRTKATVEVEVGEVGVDILKTRTVNFARKVKDS